RNFRTVVAGLRTHVAVGQLEPGLGEGLLELVRVLEEVTRDLLVLRVEAQREVARQHRRANALVLVVSVRNGTVAHAVLRLPLVCACRALGQLPLIAEQVPEEVVRPLGRGGRPGDFQARTDGVGALAGAELARPAEALLSEASRLRLRTDERSVARAVGLAEGVAAGD